MPEPPEMVKTSSRLRLKKCFKDPKFSVAYIRNGHTGCRYLSEVLSFAVTFSGRQTLAASRLALSSVWFFRNERGPEIKCKHDTSRIFSAKVARLCERKKQQESTKPEKTTKHLRYSSRQSSTSFQSCAGSCHCFAQRGKEAGGTVYRNGSA